MPAEATPRIPLCAHFIWFGQQFPWVNLLAVRSAALRGGFERVVLHHDSDLSSTPWYRELTDTPRVTLQRLDLAGLLERCAPHGAGLRAVYDRLRTPATRSDLVRFALLLSQGGVYLDIDTVTLGSFEPLCRTAAAFCGQERIVYPFGVRESFNPALRLPAEARSGLRDLLRRIPHGWALFRKLEGLYPLAENPAILGSAPGSPFITDAVQRMLAIAPERQPRPNAIGPHLLQQTAAAHRGDGQLTVHPPEVFFPLGPEISEHWFRTVHHADLDAVLSPATRLVHWYGSVRTKQLVPRIDPAYVQRHARTQLFSALALPFVGER